MTETARQCSACATPLLEPIEALGSSSAQPRPGRRIRRAPAERIQSMTTLLIILLLLLLLGGGGFYLGGPAYGGGGLGLVLVVLLILYLMGFLHTA